MQSIPAFYFDSAALDELAQASSAAYRDAHPFPSIVLDGFLPGEIFYALVNEFPGPSHPAWRRWGGGPNDQTANTERTKLGIADERAFGPQTRHFAHLLISWPFIQFLHTLTGWDRLTADPSFNGCGLHSTGAGGRLARHIDADRHPYGLPFHQTINVILYLNPEWKEEYGGELELCSPDGGECVQKVVPLGNRLVVFETSSVSWHGHSDPLACPAGMRRNSIAAYYYTPERELSARYQGHQSRVSWFKTPIDATK